MRIAARLGLLALAALAAGCRHDAAEQPATEQTAPEQAQAAVPQADREPTAQSPSESPAPPSRPDPAFLPPPPAPGQVPHVYMALQDGGEGRPLSVIFAIDAARNGTPSDDPAMRLTPESGLCNPQEMTRYDFPPEAAATPVVGEAEQAEGLTAADLPAYMAVAVTNALLLQGLASTPEDTRPLNICTRKLWQQLVLPESAAAAGQ